MEVWLPCWEKWSEVKVAQSRPTLCNPMDYTHGILQARILEWVACPFSKGSSQPRNQTGVSCIAGAFFTNWAIRETVIMQCYIILCSCGITDSMDMSFEQTQGDSEGRGSLVCCSSWGSQRVGHSLANNNNNNAQIITDLASGSHFSLAFVFYWYVCRILWEFFHSLV